ncbi:hypothetical protein FFLO_05332 [Filobasidium floriforme]|uniref:Mannose-6-phosphate isomerase n=1 Tax=Filobasidium floriforme TaxID=5210 RepID=A0A8K0NNY9_9TREE|nr:hypothetical protein FFLO_05332 [Filobasidium floriforme]
MGKAGEKFGAPVEAGKGERFLPFLMKVLTCKQALPLQIHPDKELSRRLHRKNPKQFADFNHKPEIAVALTPFLGFAGFQPIITIKSLLTSIPELDALLRPFESYQTFISATPKATSADLKELVRSVLRMDPKSDASGLLKTVKDALAAGTGMAAPEKEARDGNDVDAAIEGLLSRFEREGVEAFGKAELGDEEKKRLVKALKKMQEFYKGDPGSIVAAFMMNLIELRPGEGIYVGADGVHAWLDGQIIELMATSDNVLNLGFVPAAEKDSVDLFIDAVTCEPKSGEEYKLSKQEWKLSSGAGATIYKVPTEEFSLYHVDGDAQKSTTIKPLNGPTVCIVTAVNTTAGKITQTGTVDDSSARAEVDDIKRGQVYLIGAGTEVEFAPGVEVWASFWDDQEQEQSGTA